MIKLGANLDVTCKNKVVFGPIGATGQLPAGTKLIEIILQIDNKDILALYLIYQLNNMDSFDYNAKVNAYAAFKKRDYFFNNDNLLNGANQ